MLTQGVSDDVYINTCSAVTFLLCRCCHDTGSKELVDAVFRGAAELKHDCMRNNEVELLPQGCYT